MSNVMPSSELHAVALVHQLDAAEMQQLAIDAMSSSFALMATRRRILDEQISPGSAVR